LLEKNRLIKKKRNNNSKKLHWDVAVASKVIIVQKAISLNYWIEMMIPLQWETDCMDQADGPLQLFTFQKE
jgi:hypothetical protein